MISPYSRYSIILAIAVSTILQRALASSGNKYQNYQDWEYQYNSNHASNGDEYYNDDGGKADEAAVNGYYNDDQNPYENNKDTYEEGGDYIKYWTEYAILPKKCIVYNDVDMVVFSIYANGYKQCSDTAKGTYITPVPYFAQGYINQKQQDTEDQGQEYELPSAAMYAYCTPQQINQQWFYLQLGCADGNSQKLAVNIYTDNVCTNRSVVDGMDDANIDVSAIQPTFKRCAMCVNWYDHENEVDDGYYFSRMLHAPLCSTAWKYKETCDTKCQRLAMEKKQKSGWSASDNVLLAILIAFGLIMVGLIMRKREKMSNKDTLLEQAALSAAGLQQPHVLGIFVLTVLVIAVFALLGLKNITWALLLIMNTALFSYLMKLTITSSMNTADAIIGPDGTIIRKDSDESSMVSSAARSGTYNLPVID